MYFNPVKGHYNRGVPEIFAFYVISVKSYRIGWRTNSKTVKKQKCSGSGKMLILAKMRISQTWVANIAKL